MDKETKEQFETIIKGMERMEGRLTEKLREEVHGAEVRINLKIENEVSKRIESLFDGYKLAHEKQWELERKLEALEKRIESLEIKTA